MVPTGLGMTQDSQREKPASKGYTHNHTAPSLKLSPNKLNALQVSNSSPTSLVLQKLLLSKSLTTSLLLSPMVHLQSRSYFMSQWHLPRLPTSSPSKHFLHLGSKTQDSWGVWTHCLLRFFCWIPFLPKLSTLECSSHGLQTLLSKCLPALRASNAIHMPTPNHTSRPNFSPQLHRCPHSCYSTFLLGHGHVFSWDF